MKENEGILSSKRRNNFSRRGNPGPTPHCTSCCGVRWEPVYHPTPPIQCPTSESSRRPNKLANCEVEVYRKVSYSSPHSDSEIISPWSPKGTPRQSEKPYRKSPIGDKFGVRLRRRIGIPNAVFFLAGIMRNHT